MPYADVNGTRLYYQDVGTGEPMILIPGLGLDHTYYALGVPALSAELRTIAVDLRGVGRSTKDEDVEYSVRLWAEDIALLIEHLGLAGAHVLGTSLGGSIALALAARHPAKVRSLIAVGAFSELNLSVELNYSLRKRLIAKLGMSEDVADFIALWIMTPGFLESEAGREVAANIRAGVRENSPEIYRAFLDAILALGRREPGGAVPPLTAALSSITAPTLVACADNDHFIPAELSALIHRAIPHSKFVEVSGGGHIPFIEAPDRITREVLDFVRALGNA
ncbi:alpha/beta hydrolase [Crossiella sp. SN42]|uniref:alpha/beta fold hydrolase n=1 Tax=Crossiella sp. SN42 TaxID=2944808 RepID=UPI00207C4138|nr:alpha/beta hydrolase [Crossiella sp. SN42]MCO1577326.1 alpha/beta hydrolase [Crossiella sp. SN42]